MISTLLWLSSLLLLCHGAQVQYAAYNQQPQQFQEYSQVPYVQYYNIRSGDVPLPSEIRNPPKAYSEEEQQSLLKQAMKSAWEQYGPTGTLKMRPEAHASWALGNSTLVHRDTSTDVQPQETPSFQSTESEWDKHINPRIPPPRVPLEPTWFSRFLNQYLDFEVNHYDVAEFIRRAFVVVLVGLAVLVWIGVGAALGFLPGKMLTYFGVDRKRDITSRGDEGGNDLMSDITDRVYLALDGDWLKKLEDRVLGSDSANWLTTHVRCCILPDAKTSGMADCQLMKRQKRDGTFKCLTDFIYSFQFGPHTMKPLGPSSSSNKANKTESH